MTANLLEAETGDDRGAQDDLLAVPEKFRDPQTGAIRVDQLVKSYRALEQKLAGMVALPGEDSDDDSRLRFHRAMGGLQKETMVHVLAMRAVLTPQQAAQFDDTVVRSLTQEPR